LIAFTDDLPVKKKREAVKKGLDLHRFHACDLFQIPKSQSGEVVSERGRIECPDDREDVVAASPELHPRIRFGCYHHPCASNKWLQVADYCAWAMQRKWERDDPRTYDLLRGHLVKSELNVTARGTTTYY
jgi:hypothetical protein